MNAVVSLPKRISAAIIRYWVFFIALITYKGDREVNWGRKWINILLELSRRSLVFQVTFSMSSWQAFEVKSTNVVSIVLSVFGSENIRVCTFASCLPLCAAFGLHFGYLIPHSWELLSSKIWRRGDVLALLCLRVGWNLTQHGEYSQSRKVFKHLLQIIFYIKLRDLGRRH